PSAPGSRTDRRSTPIRRGSSSFPRRSSSTSMWARGSGSGASLPAFVWPMFSGRTLPTGLAIHSRRAATTRASRRPGRFASTELFDQLVDSAKENAVPILMMVLKPLLVSRLLSQKGTEQIRIGARRGETVPVLFDVTGIHLLLELVPHGHAEDRLTEEDGLVDE